MKLLLLLVVVVPVLVLLGCGQTSGQLTQAPTANVGWFSQTLDHFSFEPEKEWQQRYLWTDIYYDPSKPNGALFFYTGNEGDIYMFWNNTGFLFDLAQQMNARVLFCEHRYYGESQPFGKESLLRPRYLSSEQALADYARFLQWYQSQSSTVLPVISFGGSYGGMLSSWFRMKYPNIVTGSLASSAPILQFEGLAGYDPNEYNQIIYNDYASQSSQCASTLQSSFPTIASLAQQGSSGLQTITNSLGLCSPLTQQELPRLNSFLSTAMTYMAMTDYPGASDFLQAMPSYPVSVACKLLTSVLDASPATTPAVVLEATRAAIGVYYNWSGTQSCFDILQGASANLGDAAWDIQACTEMVFPINSGGLFPASLFNLTSYVDDCRLANLVARPYWVSLNFQSDQIAQLNSNKSTAQPPLGFSQIIFSNGQLDPWRSGGVTKSLSADVIAIVIEDGAHHVDLRFATPEDPPTVTAARAQEKQIIQSWITSFYSQRAKIAILE